jgi:hypothetical protein
MPLAHAAPYGRTVTRCKKLPRRGKTRHRGQGSPTGVAFPAEGRHNRGNKLFVQEMSVQKSMGSDPSSRAPRHRDWPDAYAPRRHFRARPRDPPRHRVGRDPRDKSHKCINSGLSGSAWCFIRHGAARPDHLSLHGTGAGGLDDPLIGSGEDHDDEAVVPRHLGRYFGAHEDEPGNNGNKQRFSGLWAERARLESARSHLSSARPCRITPEPDDV